MATSAAKPSLAFMLVFWFLIVVAMPLALLAPLQMQRTALQNPFEVVVESRDVNLVVHEVRYSKPERLVPRLYGEYKLSMVRVDSSQGVEQVVLHHLSQENLVSLEFLDRYQPGSRLKAIEKRDGSGALDFEPEKRWFGVVGILFAAWMLGTFAWMVRSFATRTANFRSMAPQFLSLAVLLVAVVACVAWLDRIEKGGKASRPRVAVEGFSKKLTREQFVAKLRSVDVSVAEGVVPMLAETLRFCEYRYAGQTWRTTSPWCQPSEDLACPGRLNPDNPRDVKWGQEP